jgi:predicted transcriptional regulator
MKLAEIVRHLECEPLWDSGKMGTEVTSCMASDMMSDVLAYAKPGSLLITGLISSQSVRTAEVADFAGIVYVRGKKPDEQTIELAKELLIPLFSTEHGMFEACWILRSAGLEGIC